MNQPLSKQTNNLFSNPQVFTGIGAGLLLGAASLLFSPLWVLVFLLAIFGLLLIGKKPEFAIIGIIIFLCTVIPERNIPTVNVGIRLYISDVLTLALLFFIFIRRLVNPNYKLITSPLDMPIIMFIVWAVVITIFALISGDVNEDFAKSEIRIIVYYLLFFTVTNLVPNQKTLNFILNTFYFLAMMVAISMIIQFVFGNALPFLGGRIEVLKNQGENYSDITRITDTVGEGLITAAFISKTIIFLTSKLRMKRTFDLIQWGIISVGFVITFNRTHWISAAFVITLVAIFTGWQEKQRIIYWLLLLFYLSPIIIIPALVNPNLTLSKVITGALSRVLTINLSEADDKAGTSTFRWRDFEYKYGIPAIENNPITGLGLGAIYRPFLNEIDHEGFDGRAYTHNAHMWIAMKTGITGYVLFHIISILFVVRALRYWKKIPIIEYRSTLVGFALTYVAISITAILHPIYMTLFWTPIIALMWGIVEVIIRLHNNGQLVMID